MPFYSQGSGEAEIRNHTILDSLCKSLDKAKDKWVVLWAYWTTKCISMGETLFSLVYGTKTIIPADVYMPTLCKEEDDWDQNAAQYWLAQDQSKERQRQATIQIVTYQ